LIVQSVLPFFGILLFLVLVHEFGHFITAKLFKVKVLEFGVGFPPKLWGKKLGETEYTVNLLPLGGFVRLLGEEDPSDPRSLAARPAWQRLIVLLAGALMNLALPVLLFSAYYMIPQEQPFARPVITTVAPGSPAEQAGLRVGDQIVAINGNIIHNPAELSYQVKLNIGSEMMVRVRRAGDGADIPVYARVGPPQGEGPMGVVISSAVTATYTEQYPPWEAVPKAWTSTWESLTLARNEVRTWFAGRGAPQVSGPVGIAQATGEVVDQAGWVTLLSFAALLSINLAVLNVLPLPMLDGGRIFFVLIEIARRGKRISPQKEGMVHVIGFVTMLGLVALLSFFDIQRIISGDQFFR
jgi:regulator of sigma E protease